MLRFLLFFIVFFNINFLNCEKVRNEYLEIHNKSNKKIYIEDHNKKIIPVLPNSKVSVEKKRTYFKNNTQKLCFYFDIAILYHYQYDNQLYYFHISREKDILIDKIREIHFLDCDIIKPVYYDLILL